MPGSQYFYILKKATLTLLRFPFSLLLMPVFWFAVCTIENPDWTNILISFIIIHVLVYPASNGYNSYEDRDETAIGGIEHPPPPSTELYRAALGLDAAAVLGSLFISVGFAAGILVYILFSRAYSYRGIRLKKYPVIGYLTVIINQGALIYFLVQYAATETLLFNGYGMAAASLLIGGFYPLTQVYQHESDAKDGVRTISMLLGKRGTFLFCGTIYALAFAMLFVHFQVMNRISYWYVLQLFFVPVGFVFVQWAFSVHRHAEQASYRRTMRMSLLAAMATNLAFLTLTLLQYFGLH